MRNEYKVNKKTVMSHTRELRHTGRTNLFFFVAWVVVAPVALILTVLTAVLRMHWFMVFIMVLTFLLSLYKILIEPLVMGSSRYKLLSANAGAEEWTSSIDFREEDILLSEGNTTLTCKYTDIISIKEKGNNIWIFFNKGKMVMRLYKDTFVDCEWEECKAMILSKSKKEENK